MVSSREVAPRNPRVRRHVSAGVRRQPPPSAVALVAALALLSFATPRAVEPAVAAEQQLAFLKSAKVVGSRPIGKGITGALRLTLSDGQLTHDAAFQSVDERSSLDDIRNGKRRAGEVRFVDSYRYNIAAWEMSRLLALDAMMPPTIERQYQGKPGALSWWMDDVLMDEAERESTNAGPPAGQTVAMVRERQRMMVFAELLFDTDRNKGNVLYTRDWRVIMLDFTRAFRTEMTIRRPDVLESCDRHLLARLRALGKEEISRVAGRHLTSAEIDAVMQRRRLIVEHFDRLVKTRGEGAVLY